MVTDMMYREMMESLAIKAASKVIDEAYACGIIEDEYEAQAQFCRMVEDFKENRDEYYLKNILKHGLDAIYGPGFQHIEAEEIL